MVVFAIEWWIEKCPGSSRRTRSSSGRSGRLRMEKFFYGSKAGNFAQHRFKGGCGGGETNPFLNWIAEGQAGRVRPMENVAAAGSVCCPDRESGMVTRSKPAARGCAPATVCTAGDNDN